MDFDPPEEESNDAVVSEQAFAVDVWYKLCVYVCVTQGQLQVI